MSRAARAVLPLLALTLLAAGCGTAVRPASAPAAPPAPPSLATATVAAGGSWAVAVLGGSAAQYNNFWQLFARPADSARWQLVTPPGVASNGGLVIASLGQRSLVAGFRPSQDLVFTPLAVTGDDGTSWSAGVLDAALADAPDALAADPGGSGGLLALLASGTVQFSARGGAGWMTLASRRSVAATAAGRWCGLRALTAVAFGPAGTPMVGGACTRAGTAGVFARAAGTWRAAGPALPAALARQNVTVLRLATTTGGTAALLAAGSGRADSLVAAWSAGGGPWAESPPLRLAGTPVTSVSFAPGGVTAIVLAGRRGETVTRPGGPWQSLPALPPGTATLAPVPGGLDALAGHGARLTVWQLAPGGASWASVQTINVPIQYGSSG